MSVVRRLRSAARRLPCVSLLLGAIAVALQFVPQASQWLQYDRAAIASGQLWRVLTCHLTHCSLDHLVWDVGVLVLLGWLCESHNRRPWAACLVLAAVSIPLAIGILLPQLQTYRGLSGIDSALFVMLAVIILKDSLRHRRTFQTAATGLVLFGFIAKTVYELASGQTVFVDSAAAAMIPVPLAHVVGATIGLVSALAIPDRRSRRTLLTFRM